MSKESKHVKNFKKNHLKTNETLVAFGDGYIGEAMGSGDKKQQNGSLMVSEERVIFYKKGLFGEILETIPLKSITSIERKSKLGHQSLHMHTSHDSLQFKSFDKASMQNLYEWIEECRGASVDQNQSVPVTPVSQIVELSPIEKIKQLGELKEAGVLSTEEFESKKAELLAQI